MQTLRQHFTGSLLREVVIRFARTVRPHARYFGNLPNNVESQVDSWGRAERMVAKTHRPFQSASGRTQYNSNQIMLDEGGGLFPPPVGPTVFAAKEFVMSTLKAGANCDSDDSTVSKKGACSNVFEGEVVRVTKSNLVTKCSQGNEHRYRLEQDVQFSCDGTDCNVDEIQVGRKVRVTTKQDDPKAATCVECLDQQVEFSR